MEMTKNPTVVNYRWGVFGYFHLFL